MNLLYFSKLLDQLLEVLTNLNSPLVPFLQLGVSIEYIKEETSTIPLNIPEELFIFYGWKNGITNKNIEDYPLSTFELFTLANPISIEDSIEIHKFHAIDKNYWENKYFPLFESGLGDYFLQDIDSKSETSGMIMFFSPISPYFQGVITIADSFVSLIETILSCYKEKIYNFQIDAEGKKYLTTKSHPEFTLWEKHNPKSQYRKVLQSFNH